MRVAVRMAVGALVLALAASVGSGVARAAEPQVTVMTRNIYLGADVSVALALLPDFPAAAQFMWDQMVATDINRRAPQLAAEASSSRPDVIGIQEATRWLCQPSLLGGQTLVFDFLQEFLQASRDAGNPYVVAEHDGSEAVNQGFAIGPIPGLTMVRDPAVFQPIFGTDEAACGFTIADALLVREGLAGEVLAAGTTEYDQAYPIVPGLLVIERGYVWADISIQGTPARFVTTHLEAASDADVIPNSAIQARQLVDDLGGTAMPLIVMGDFNSDPRDPREPKDNPGEQPVISPTCSPQPAQVSADTADSTCNAYWVMRSAGYQDAGPDAATNFTWGFNALLAGPDAQRLPFARADGNDAGLTDRLDYVFTRGATATSARLVGHTWPEGSNAWTCDDPRQEQLAAEAGAALGVDVPESACLPSDHAGVVADIRLDPSTVVDAAPPSHRRAEFGSLRLAALGIMLGIIAAAALTIRSRRREKT